MKNTLVKILKEVSNTIYINILCGKKGVTAIVYGLVTAILFSIIVYFVGYEHGDTVVAGLTTGLTYSLTKDKQ